MTDLLKTNSLDAPPVCPCINWARDAADDLPAHHPNCAAGWGVLYCRRCNVAGRTPTKLHDGAFCAICYQFETNYYPAESVPEEVRRVISGEAS